MSDYDSLLRGVLLDPADDAPRLVLADWLQENGQEDRAGYMRCPEQDHFYRAADGWLLLPDGDVAMFASGVPLQIIEGLGAKGWREGGCLRVRHGFVESVAAPCGTFLFKSVLLFRSHPVVEVRLTNKRPVTFRGSRIVGERFEIDTSLPARRGWSCSLLARDHENVAPDHYLPPAVFDRLEGAVAFKSKTSATYADDPAALKALSDACVAYGREQAGLPPLKEPGAKPG